MANAIPDRAFLRAADMPGVIKGAPRRLGDGEVPLPTFCGAGFEQADRIDARGTLRYYFSSPGAPAEATPKAMVHHQVLVYRDGGATDFMDGLRTCVTGCKSQNEDGVELRNHLHGPFGEADDSVVVEQTRPATDETGTPLDDGTLHSVFWAAARVGEAVAFVSIAGWESCSAEEADALTLGKKAARRLREWRES
ncbi:hypothetical protein ACQP2F_38150 [Actinoplanes sp. CA-030573]|uniref:hypothetical protein n=1 Tax=Actinoplanes sp. CA-030573 TaxID=3239898 RepID=UPI003D939798